MGKQFYARQFQLLEDHLRQTAEMSAGFSQSTPLASWAYTAGLWHDLGKYSDAFQRRLAGSTERVDHSTAGAQTAAALFAGDNGNLIIGRTLAYIIAGHHSGLPDGNAADETCLRARLKKGIPPYSACPARLLEKPPLSVGDVMDILGKRADGKSFAFGISFFIRMLFSCLVDADRLDSEAAESPGRAEIRKIYPSLSELHWKLTTHLDTLAAGAEGTPINGYRAGILDQCRRMAESPPGLFSLTVPTGGGKTLSSLAFALEHCLRHGLRRVIYAIPYTSIIEQTASVFRACLGDDAVVEHHSNFEPPDEPEDPSFHSLATENWDAPIIVTTNVQLFESLFSNKPSRCRRLHNVMNSVIILDEAQMLPPGILSPCVEAIRELTSRYHTSVVLCTATQPALNRGDGFPDGLENVREIVAEPEALSSVFKRVGVKVLGKKEDDEIAAMIGERERVLCIVNTKARARRLFEKYADREGTYHLSAMMCPEHRSEIIAEIKTRLSEGAPCRVVSTQLIEAGVDVDFPVVFREMAGIDSIAQAAGRCNREGKLLPRLGEVFVFESADGTPRIFRQQVQTAQTVIRRHGNDVLSLGNIREYFRDLYWTKGPDRLDGFGILNALSAGAEKMDFPFREIGEKFRFISEDTVSVVIPWEKTGPELIKKLRAEHPPRSVLRAAQRFSVSVYRTGFRSLFTAGAVEPLNPSLSILVNESLYDRKTGLKMENPQYRDPEDNIS